MSIESFGEFFLMLNYLLYFRWKQLKAFVKIKFLNLSTFDHQEKKTKTRNCQYGICIVASLKLKMNMGSCTTICKCKCILFHILMHIILKIMKAIVLELVLWEMAFKT